MISHLNVNSIRNKFNELSVILHKHFVDILVVSETKVDKSYGTSLFKVHGYKMYRKDKTDKSGGLLIYVSDQIPNSQGN